ncbi:NRDE family protein [Roseateles sp. DC23W]|uniref:NRDE family protein n=1 Tax=Pelomonas dachongensis TaxID=3299029 RepID=A0ABW7EIR7_9BURK
MCLAAFALNAHPRFPLVIAANRDEFFARPAAPMTWWWAQGTDILAGRDLVAGGTWFGLTRAGRLALLTNVREPARQDPDAPSRGALVVDWLTTPADAMSFARGLPEGYNGFNLIAADLAQDAWHWISNRAPHPQPLGDGIHGVSNAALDTPWPKTVGLKAALAAALADGDNPARLTDVLFAALADDRPAADADLPDTGVGLARERLLSPRFVRLLDPQRPGQASYGTRCATVLVVEALADGRRVTHIAERSIDVQGQPCGDVRHTLAASRSPSRS